MLRTIRRSLVVLITLPLLLAAAGSVLLRQSRGAFGTAFEIRPGLAQVLYTGAHVYAYAARAGDKVILFDTGTDPSGKGIDALLTSLYAQRANVEDIFLTHGHNDHVAGVALFPHARIHAGSGDVDLVTRKASPDRAVAAVMAMLAPSPVGDVSDPLNAEGDVEVGGGKKVHAIPVAGHTAGSYAYLYEGVLFVGDSLVLDHGKLTSGPGFFTTDPSEQADSVKALQATAAKLKIEMVCTGHGGCTRSGEGAETLSRAAVSQSPWAPLF